MAEASTRAADQVRKKERDIGYKSVLDFGRAPPVYYPHTIGEYPTKIFPGAATMMVKRFSREGDIILDPFCGCGTFAVEAKLAARNSINYDINPVGVDLTRRKLAALNGVLDDFDPSTPVLRTTHRASVADARSLPIENDSIDCVITDIPYANMVRYSDIPADLSTIENYETFLAELSKAFGEITRVLRKGRYCVIFACDYRVGAARRILPVHADVIQLMTRQHGLVLFDIYVWRYYRSGGFRPFGAKPYQAMNLHSYIMIFYRPTGSEDMNRKNRPIRYRPRLIEKQAGVAKRLKARSAQNGDPDSGT